MRKKFVLCLGSGGIRGFAHLGVYKALAEYEIEVDAIYGTSVGSLVGSFISDGWPAEKLIDFSLNLSPLGLLDFTWPMNGFIKGIRLNQFIKKNISQSKIENLKIPLIVTATNAKTGQVNYFRSGTIADRVQASCSIPGVFRPAIVDDIEYLDGDLASPVPMRQARLDHGGDAVILAVNIIGNVDQANRKKRSWARRFSKDSYRQAIVGFEKSFADIYIEPDLEFENKFSKEAAQKRIQAGYESAMQIIPKLKQILDTV